MTKIPKPEFRVYTRWIAYELRKQGYKILKTEVNEYNPEFKVWVFWDSPELQHTFHQIVETGRPR